MPNVTVHVFHRNDLNATPVFTITDEDPDFKGISLRPALGEMGGGELRLSRGVAASLTAQEIGPEAFVRVIIHAISDTRYVWGFFLTERRHIVLSTDEEAGEDILLSGPGPLFYLDTVGFWHERFSTAGGQVDLANGVWRFPTGANAGRVLSAMFAEDTDNEIASTPTPFLADLTRTFDVFDDSSSTAWVEDFPEELELRIGESILNNLYAIQDAVESLDVTFDLGSSGTPKMEISAFDAPIGEDRTGTSLGAGTVLWKAGVNIVTGLEATGRSRRKASHVLVIGDEGSYAVAERPAWDPGEYTRAIAIQHAGISNVASLQRRGQRYIRKWDFGEDEIELEIIPGFAVSSGFYFPDPDVSTGHFWLGDSISLKTGPEVGASPLDYDYSTERITGIRMVLGQASIDTDATAKARSWHVVVELNIERGGASAPREGQGAGGVGCRCLQLCGAGGIIGEVVDESHANELSFGYIDPADGTTEVELWHDTGLGPTASTGTSGIQLWYLRDHTCNFLFLSDDTTHCRITRHTDGRLLLRWLDGDIDCSRPPGTGQVPSAPDAAFNNIGIALSVEDDADGQPDLIGTSPRAARCDHSHTVLRSVAPSADDDETQGFTIGDTWTVVGNGTYILVDASEGAAVWQEAGAVGDFLEKVGGEKHTVNTVASSGTTETLDLADGNLHDVTLTDDCTFAFAGATNGEGCYLTLILRQDATGGRAVTWPASVSWPDDTAPALSTDANDVSILSFLSRDGGVTWFGAFQGGSSSVVALDDLSDVTITTPAAGHKLRHNGSGWVNANLHDEPMMASDGSVMTDGLLNPMMHEVAW